MSVASSLLHFELRGPVAYHFAARPRPQSNVKRSICFEIQCTSIVR